MVLTCRVFTKLASKGLYLLGHKITEVRKWVLFYGKSVFITGRILELFPVYIKYAFLNDHVKTVRCVTLKTYRYCYSVELSLSH